MFLTNSGTVRDGYVFHAESMFNCCNKNILVEADENVLRMAG